MPHSLNRSFSRPFPGPFACMAGNSGVDDTFDVVCLQSGQHIASTYYWTDRLPSELIACVIAESLNALHPNAEGHEPFIGEPLSDQAIQMFCGMHTGPFRAASTTCDLYGPGHEVLCTTSGKSVIAVYSKSPPNQASIIADQFAAALNILISNSQSHRPDLGSARRP